MLEPWNNSSVLPPPVHTLKCDTDIDVKLLMHICNGIIRILSKQSPLHREGAILSRFVYKFDKKFRNDIGYRNFKKVNTALRKWLALNLLKDVQNFASVLPNNDDEVYSPTRQMLEYVLVRIITFSKLMLRICLCSKQSAIFYLDRIKRGESHWMCLMPYAILSRVWSMSRVLLQHCCNWYTNLHPFLVQLKLKGLDFLPFNYNLPLDLEEWLDLKNLENFGKFEWAQKKQIKIDQALVDDEEGDKFDTILEYVNQINSGEEREENSEQIFSEKTIETKLNVTVKCTDQGEAISRDTFKQMLKGSFLSEPKINHSTEMVTNKDSLLHFITTEEKLRNECSDQSLTRHLSFMQWQAIKNTLQKLVESLSTNRKIQRKFLKIWSEKCLNCQ